MCVFGIVIYVSEKQSEKAYLPMEVTLFGIVILVNELHPKKVFEAISEDPDGILNDDIYL